MSDETTSHDPAASIWRTLTLSDDPFTLRLDDICGLDDEREKLRTTYLPGLTDTAAPVRAPCLSIYGPRGRGKSRFARAIAGELSAHGFACAHLTPDDIPDRDSHHQGRTEPEIGYVLDQLTTHQPATLVLEDLQEVPLNSNGDVHTAIETIRRKNARVAVICVLTQDHPRMTPHDTPEYFEFADILIELDEVDTARRANLLNMTLRELTATAPATSQADTTRAIEQADEEFRVDAIEDICRRAILLARTDADENGTVQTENIRDAIEQVGAEHTEPDQSTRSRQSSTDDLFDADVPSVTFDEIGGLDDIIRRVDELLTYPNQYATLYDQTTLSPSTGVLLQGPPGTGKTLLAKALATETDRVFYSVEGATVKSKWFGESEARIRRLFEAAREEAPSLIFFDEFDAIAGDRSSSGHSVTRSIVNTLLAELDGVTANDDLLVVAATNRPDVIDPALTRSGRLGEAIAVPAPDDTGLREIFRIHTEGLSIADVDAAWFVAQVPEGTTGADVAAIVERALHLALRRRGDGAGEPRIERDDVRDAIEMHVDQTPEVLRGFE